MVILLCVSEDTGDLPPPILNPSTQPQIPPRPSSLSIGAALLCCPCAPAARLQRHSGLQNLAGGEQMEHQFDSILDTVKD